MKNKKLLFGILAIVAVGLLAGFIYLCFFRPVEYIQIKVPVGYPQLRVVAEIARTQYQVGEEITVKPYLINRGKRPITVFGGVPILFAKVYDAENRVVLWLPIWGTLDILAPRTLKPQIPYYPYDVEDDVKEAFTFTLDQPGRYKIVAWAEFSLDEGYAYPLHIYADPIWIEVE